MEKDILLVIFQFLDCKTVTNLMTINKICYQVAKNNIHKEK